MAAIVNRDNDSSQRAGMQSERLTGGYMDGRAAGTHVQTAHHRNRFDLRLAIKNTLEVSSLVIWQDFMMTHFK